MKQILSNISKAALNLIFPMYCQGCKKLLEYHNNLYLCQECFGKLNSLYASSRTSAGNDSCIIKIYHCCRYEGLVKELIHKFKYSNKIFLQNAFVVLLHKLFIEKIASKKIDTIMPVPMYHADEIKKGFNQSSLLAKGLSKKTGIIFENTLVKSRKTPAQAGLKRMQRLNNIKNAFSLNKYANPRNKCILIIDDVFTTGATIQECANTLSSSGTDSIIGLTLANGI